MRNSTGIRIRVSMRIVAIAVCMHTVALQAQDVMTLTAGADVGIELDGPGKAKKLRPLVLEWEVGESAREQATDLLDRMPGEALGAELACSATAGLKGDPVAGVPVRFEFSPTQSQADVVFEPPPVTRKSGDGGSAFAIWDVGSAEERRALLGEAVDEAAVLVFEIAMKKKKQIDAYGASCELRVFERCQPDATTLCLFDDRFAVTATFRDFDGTPGVAQAQERNDREGFFWFFNQGQEEFLVRILNECSDFDRFWVFAGGLTPLEHEITVMDTHTGEVKVYDNPLGAPSPPITDTTAFATCP